MYLYAEKYGIPDEGCNNVSYLSSELCTVKLSLYQRPSCCGSAQHTTADPLCKHHDVLLFAQYQAINQECNPRDQCYTCWPGAFLAPGPLRVTLNP